MRMVLLFVGCAATLALPIIFACTGVGGGSAPERADAPDPPEAAPTEPVPPNQCERRATGTYGTAPYVWLCKWPEVDCIVTLEHNTGTALSCRWKEQVK